MKASEQVHPKTGDNGPGGQVQAIAIHLGDERYGIRTQSVREVLSSPLLTRVPKAPPYVRGVINLRGTVLAVVDLPTRLGLSHVARESYSWVVVVEVDGEPVGIGAERTSKLMRLGADQIAPPPPILAGISGENIEGVARLDDGFLIFLDLHRTLGIDAETRVADGTDG